MNLAFYVVAYLSCKLIDIGEGGGKTNNSHITDLSIRCQNVNTGKY